MHSSPSFIFLRHGLPCVAQTGLRHVGQGGLSLEIQLLPSLSTIELLMSATTPSHAMPFKDIAWQKCTERFCSVFTFSILEFYLICIYRDMCLHVCVCVCVCMYVYVKPHIYTLLVTI
jgi:hypothetical protein